MSETVGVRGASRAKPQTRQLLRPVKYPKTVVVRVDDELHEALQRDAEANGRTVAQSVRFHLSRSLGL